MDLSIEVIVKMFNELENDRHDLCESVVAYGSCICPSTMWHCCAVKINIEQMAVVRKYCPKFNF